MKDATKGRRKSRAAQSPDEIDGERHPSGEEDAITRGTPPVDYSAEIAEAICERVALGEALRQIALLPQMPGEATVYRWLRDHPEFRTRVAEAKALQTEKLAEEMIEIADDTRNDWVRRESECTGKAAIVFATENVQRARLRVAVRQWLISRRQPKTSAANPASEFLTNAGGQGRVMTEERRAVLMEKRREAVLRRQVDAWGGEGEAEWGKHPTSNT